MCFSNLQVISITLILAVVATAARGQEAESKNPVPTHVPSWVSDSVLIPLERERAVRKLTYFLESDYLRQPDDVAREMVLALNGAGLPKEPRTKLNEWYARLLRWQIESWPTLEIRARIRVEIAKRDARTRQLEVRLKRIVEELADLADEAKGSDVAVNASNALQAAGYLVESIGIGAAGFSMAAEVERLG